MPDETTRVFVEGVEYTRADYGQLWALRDRIAALEAALEAGSNLLAAHMCSHTDAPRSPDDARALVDTEGPVLLIALDYAVDQLANFAKRGVSQPYAEKHYKGTVDKLGAFVQALIVERHRLADALEAAMKDREDDIVRRLRERVHEAEAQDIALFTRQSNTEIAQHLRDNLPWIPTALHALLHAAADRLARAEPDTEEGQDNGK